MTPGPRVHTIRPDCGRTRCAPYATALGARPTRGKEAVIFSTPRTAPVGARRVERAARRALAALVAVCALGSGSAGQVHLPAAQVEQGVVVEANEAGRWRQGAYDVWRLAGGVKLKQSDRVWRGDEAIVWVDQPTAFDAPTKLIVYLEGSEQGPATVELFADEHARRAATETGPSWFGRLYTIGGIEWRTPSPDSVGIDKPRVFTRALARFAEEDPSGEELADRAVDRRRPPDGSTRDRPYKSDPLEDEAVAPAQFLGELPSPFETVAPAPTPLGVGTPAFRTIELFPRQGAGLQGEYLTTPSGESVAVLSGGLNLLVTGVSAEGLPVDASLLGADAGGAIDRLDLEADRAVIWTTGVSLGGGSVQQSGETPLEIYLEGNIVFRQGDRTIYAERLFYDARRKTGVILDAELLTPPPDDAEFDPRGLIRLKAAAIRQLDDARFVATDALLTTSRLEEPSYSLRSDTITFEDDQRPLIDPRTGQQAVDPFTGAPRFDREQLATSQGNRVVLGSVPVLYWPTIATDLTEPAYYIEGFQVRNDNVFGTQLLTKWDVYQLLGADAPDGTDWDVILDYLDDRGFGFGSEYDYGVDSFSGFEGPARGTVDAWFIDDFGVDNLGEGRRSIDPEESFRGRVFWNHRQKVRGGLLDGWIAEIQAGWISDRTFLEQYYENDWDEGPDRPTGFRLRRLLGNQSLSIEANAQLNEFFTETQWLPRLDHWLIGHDLGGQTVTWFAHSHVGYADYSVATEPVEPTLAGLFGLFPWEVEAEGERAATRQEIDLPLEVDVFGAPVKVVPFFLGEIAHWGEDLTGNDLQRGYLHTGVRASLPFWAVNPNVRDPLFNLNGLAHKIVLDAEASFAESNRTFDELPLFDAIEDNALEEIRRQQTGGAILPEFDPRFWLVRNGIQGVVAAPTTDIVDDLTVVRLGARNRLQTKRGAPGQERIIDWLTFDANVSIFPEEEQNFGETIGLIDYDARWAVGDRTTILSDGFVDLFLDGLQTFAIGLDVNRPARGNFYLGYRTIRGPFNSDLLIGRVNYRLGPKWITSLTSVVDFGEAGNIGQNFSLSRIGEALIVTIGASVDESKDRVGFNFLIEPRFLPKSNLTRKTGIDVPPAGAFGLE